MQVTPLKRKAPEELGLTVAFFRFCFPPPILWLAKKLERGAGAFERPPRVVLAGVREGKTLVETGPDATAPPPPPPPPSLLLPTLPVVIVEVECEKNFWEVEKQRETPERSVVEEVETTEVLEVVGGWETMEETAEERGMATTPPPPPPPPPRDGAGRTETAESTRREERGVMASPPTPPPPFFFKKEREREESGLALREKRVGVVTEAVKAVVLPLPTFLPPNKKAGVVGSRILVRPV